jgi:hypothetical protein
MVEGTPGVIFFSLRETWQKLKGAVTAPLIWAALFLFIWRATPSSGGAFSYFLIDELKFSPEFFGRLSLISHAMGIVGVLCFRKFLMRVALRKLFCGIIIAGVVLSLPTLGLIYGWYEILGVSPQFFAMADTLIAAPLAEIGFLPLMVLIARICPAGLEATMFAILASLANIGLALSDMGGAALSSFFDIRQAADPLGANYANLHIVMWIAILSSFLPMPFLWKLPETRVDAELGRGAAAELAPTAPSAERAIATPLEPGKQEVA